MVVWPLVESCCPVSPRGHRVQLLLSGGEFLAEAPGVFPPYPTCTEGGRPKVFQRHFPCPQLINVMHWSYHRRQNTPSRTHRVYMFRRRNGHGPASTFSTSVGIPSGPGTLPLFIKTIASFSSASVNRGISRRVSGYRLTALIRWSGKRFMCQAVHSFVSSYPCLEITKRTQHYFSVFDYFACLTKKALFDNNNINLPIYLLLKPRRNIHTMQHTICSIRTDVNFLPLDEYDKVVKVIRFNDCLRNLTSFLVIAIKNWPSMPVSATGVLPSFVLT